MTDLFKKKLFVLVLVITLLPFLLNLLGVDFGSQFVPLITSNDTNFVISHDDQFQALSGAFHHALMEWSAVTLALIAAIASFFHYHRCRNISVAIIGLAFLCAGFIDAFHTLAATRIIASSAPSNDFIPFTWALSRLFNVCMLIAAGLLSLWFTRRASPFHPEAKINSVDSNKTVSYQDKILIVISCLFIGFSLLTVLLATSATLPQTTFPNAFITRPYDVIPLALFIFTGSLIWSWYQNKHTNLRLALLLSIIPEVATQLHMTFGSTALFDNHFNIAHLLKVFAYSILTFGLLASLFKTTNQVEVSSISEQSIDDLLIQQSSINNDKEVINQGELLDIGIAKYPQTLLVSVFTFALSIVITVLVSSIYNVDTEKLAKEKRLNELASHGDFIELLVRNTYQDSREEYSYLQVNLTHMMEKVSALKFINRRIYIAAEDGTIFYSNTPEFIEGNFASSKIKLQQLFPSLEQAIENNLKVLQLGLTDAPNKQKNKIPLVVQGHYRTIILQSFERENVMRLFIEMDEKALLEKIAMFKNRSLLIGFGLALVALAFAVLISRKLSNSLKVITKELVCYSFTGKVNNLPIHAQDESGVLARSFHNLLAIKSAQDKALKQQKDALDEHAIVSITDVRGDIKYTNEKFIQISRYSKEELLGKNHRLLSSGLHQSAFFQSLYQTITRGEPWQGEMCNRAKDGHLYWVNTTIVPFLAKNGRPESYVSISTDITSNKLTSQKLQKAKEELSQQISKLEQANAELDQFAYVASHDLKSPLNGITQLVTWLEEDCHEILPQESREHLVLLKSRSKRMIALLNDLLDYSRAGRQEYPDECFNLAQLVADVFDLQGNREGFTCEADNVEISLQKVPFELVIRNLVSNALKHHDKPTGKITITLTKSDKFYRIRVQDDGPGIPPKLHNKALEMFQTLQSRDKTEGSGMGLALVQKTVLHQGGTLAIDSNGKRGTGIIIIWPIAAPPRDKKDEKDENFITNVQLS
ncbi:MAG: PAS domain S-box-containing protein [Alteromonadaceae bacterium]|jgi:PAS domain S-box-containing protein